MPENLTPQQLVAKAAERLVQVRQAAVAAGKAAFTPPPAPPAPPAPPR